MEHSVFQVIWDKPEIWPGFAHPDPRLAAGLEGREVGHVKASQKKTRPLMGSGKCGRVAEVFSPKLAGFSTAAA
jgi:hypothetical protein